MLESGGDSWARDWQGASPAFPVAEDPIIRCDKESPLQNKPRFLASLPVHLPGMISIFQYTFVRSTLVLGGACLMVLGFGTRTPLSAQLQWEATQIDHLLKLGQERSEAVFRFENIGDYPVTIRSTSSSCGCTTAELKQRLYQPGEKGEIKTLFEVGGRTGSRRNAVQVFTDDPSAPSTTLVYAVEIPTLVTITPRLQQWRVGTEPEEKIVRVEINPEANLKITGVTVDNDNFQAVLREGDNPGEYLLGLTPRQTKSAARAVFALQTDSKIENQGNFSFYAFIR